MVVLSLADAVRIVAHRDAFPDLNAALGLIGATTDPTVPAPSLSTTGPVSLPTETGPVDVSDLGWTAADLVQVDADLTRVTPPEDERAPVVGGALALGQEPDHDGRPFPAPRPPSVIASVIDHDGDAGVIKTSTTPDYRSVPRRASTPASGQAGRARALDQRTLSSALHGLVRVWRAGREVDIDATVDRIASGAGPSRPITLPVRRQPDRVRLLCDITLRSGPFREDLRLLMAQCRRTFSDHRLEVMAFRGSPEAGCGAGPVWTWSPLAEYPVVARTVLVAAGVSTTARGPELLREFAERETQAGRATGLLLFGAPPTFRASSVIEQLLVRD